MFSQKLFFQLTESSKIVPNHVTWYSMLSNRTFSKREDRLKVGIICGTGLENTCIMENRKEVCKSTPFGAPSDILTEGDFYGVKVYALPRHGRKHDINPSNVNYRANIWALRDLGCTLLLVTNACGSLREYIAPGHMVVPHDIIDHTHGRKNTFYDGSEKKHRSVLHLPMYPAFSEDLRQVLINTIKTFDVCLHKKGVMVAINGPRYSTRTESRMFQSWGGDIIGMTTMPEAILAKEAGMLYASLAFVTDYDPWRDDANKVNTEDVMKTSQQNVEKVKEIFILAIKNISKMNWDEPLADAEKLIESNFLSKA